MPLLDALAQLERADLVWLQPNRAESVDEYCLSPFGRQC
jgi:hypothetical protein